MTDLEAIRERWFPKRAWMPVRWPPGHGPRDDIKWLIDEIERLRGLTEQPKKRRGAAHG